MTHAPLFVYLRSISKLGTRQLVLLIRWIMDVIITSIVVVFLIPTSCMRALRCVNRRPLACMGLSSLVGSRRWHLYIFGSHATQLVSHSSIGCQHLLQPWSCEMRSGYISCRVSRKIHRHRGTTLANSSRYEFLIPPARLR